MPAMVCSNMVLRNKGAARSLSNAVNTSLIIASASSIFKVDFNFSMAALMTCLVVYDKVGTLLRSCIDLVRAAIDSASVVSSVNIKRLHAYYIDTKVSSFTFFMKTF